MAARTLSYARGHVTGQALDPLRTHHPWLNALCSVHHGVQTATDYGKNFPLGFCRQTHRLANSLNAPLLHVLDTLSIQEDTPTMLRNKLCNWEQCAAGILYLVYDWDQCVVVLVLVLVKLV